MENNYDIEQEYADDALWHEAELNQRRQHEEMTMTGHSYVKDTGGGDFELAPAGVHVAVCDMVVNLGVQESQFGAKNQHYIRWQIPAHTVEIDGEQKLMVIGSFYTSSLSEKANLRRDLESWRGRSFTEAELERFDLATIIGAPCQLNVVHKKSADGTKTIAKITAIMPLPKGTERPLINGKGILYDADYAPDTFNDLPEWLQKKITPQAANDNLQPVDDGEPFSDEIPF